MDKITVGVLTISDRCFNNEANDESGPKLMEMLAKGVIKNCTMVKKGLVPDDQEEIKHVLTTWSDEGTNLILTTGGTGLAERDVTPEATMAVLEKTVPGISQMMFKKSSDVTPLAALSRSVAGVRKRTLIVNLPGSVKGAQECLKAIAGVIPHAVDLIMGRNKKVEEVHASKTKSSAEVPRPAERERISTYPCISVSEAQKIILERIYLMRKDVVVGYKEALFHVLAQEVAAKDDLPPFHASLKDGYAVLSSDTACERIVVGDSVVSSGSCVRVNTGAPIPAGSDTVVQVEDTTLLSATEQNEEEKIKIEKLPKKGENVRPKGSDFKSGELILPSGTYLDAAGIGLLAAAGVTGVKVYKKPVVAVISTGDELVDPDGDITGGKVRDSNRDTLLSLLKEENFEAVDIGIAKDEPDDLRDVLKKGFRAADIVVTTGGMSMGEKDHLKRVLIADFKADILFGRVFMKPGKPTCCALVSFEKKIKIVFGFPGNPASSFVTSHLFLLPVLRKISGRKEVLPVTLKVKVERLLPSEDRPQYIRGNLRYNDATQSWFATVTGNQSSSSIGSCVGANCLLRVPESGVPVKPNISFSSKTSSQPGLGSTFTTNTIFSNSDSKRKEFKSPNARAFGVFGANNPPTPFESKYSFKDIFGEPETQNTEFNPSIEVTALLIGKMYT